MKTIMIIDDDTTIIKMLSMIIESNQLGKVSATLESGEYAVDEVLFYKPDILLIDLLLPVKDGIKIIQDLKAKQYSGKFIMISQVEDEQMISKAYKEGTLFYISKPINANEVVSLIREVSRVIDLERSVAIIHGALMPLVKESTEERKIDVYSRMDQILVELGISSESGAEDLKAVLMDIMKQKSLSPEGFYQLQQSYENIAKGQNARTVEQRIRRVINKAFMHIVEMGYDDLYHPIFQEYASLLFDLKQVRMEIRRIDDRDKPKGKVNIKRFIEGVLAVMNKIQ
ncbi:DNA-binding domain-containing protein [Fusibacter ferrireducens]|uniref:Stage 0 sporulation protein A homolog n=1 Tax=Fusibacter ferrireducens TaxID=2785058 RepID=A0ABR9ZQB4_9FIRM|nr:DNA-binding domain-containing protein [Fusibacter ferrireducens]MBF4692662.1 DNA-binding domain-containing protein [Fusibacter ferrireducens]